MTKPHYFEHLEMLHDSEVDPKIGPVLAQMQELRAETERLGDLLQVAINAIERLGGRDALQLASFYISAGSAAIKLDEE